jgi:hypothetical protein
VVAAATDIGEGVDALTIRRVAEAWAQSHGRRTPTDRIEEKR